MIQRAPISASRTFSGLLLNPVIPDKPCDSAAPIRDPA